MSHYSDLMGKTVSTFSFTVPTSKLGNILCGYYSQVPLPFHTALVSDTLAGKKILNRGWPSRWCTGRS